MANIKELLASMIGKINGKLNAPEQAAQPHQQLVTDADGVAKWEDKPFYESSGSVTLLDETVEGEGYVSIPLSTELYALDAEKTHKVLFNGVEYLCPVSTLDTGYMVNYRLGNLNHISASWADSGEPFALEFAEYSPASGMTGGATPKLYVKDDLPGTYTVTVSVEDKTVKTIDPKYLPDGVGGGSAGILSDEVENIELFPFSEITVSKHMYVGLYYNLPSDFPGIEYGKTYIVTYDDVIHEVKADSYELVVGEEFTIKQGQTTVYGWYLAFNNGADGDTHTLEIIEVGAKKIKNEHIPSWVASIDDIPVFVTFDLNTKSVNIQSELEFNIAVENGAIVRVHTDEAPNNRYVFASVYSNGTSSSMLWYDLADGSRVKVTVTDFSDFTFEYTKETVTT